MYLLSTPQGSEAAAVIGQERMLDKFDKVIAPPVFNPKPTLWEGLNMDSP